MSSEFFDVHKIPMNGTLDLHGFQPSETKEIVEEYLNVCYDENITQGRIIHGKGIGTQQSIVHSVLKNHPKVTNFFLGDQNSGGWGSTSFKLILRSINQKCE
jgi:dsDNA-specific endonuclease/ATPase MutS2